MVTIEELKKEAESLLQDSNSSNVAEGRGMMKVINALESDYIPSWKAITWDVLDFEGQAKQNWENQKESSLTDEYRNAEKWQDVYDESKFQEALEMMIDKHDATIGITWETIDFWLDEVCLKN